MVIARKLLAPTLAFIAVGLSILIAIYMFSSSRALVVDEQRMLGSMQQVIEREMEQLSNMTLALAQQAAHNPEVQAAFADGDRDRLLALTQSGYQVMKNSTSLDQFRFIKAPAEVLLDMDATQAFGQDLSATRPSVLAANTSQDEVAGPEAAAGGLVVHGIVPIQGKSAAGAAVNGSVEYGIALNESLFNRLQEEHSGEWQLLITTSALEAAGIQDLRGFSEAPLPELMLATSTFSRPVFADSQSYLRALEGEAVYGRVTSQGSTYAMRTFPVVDFSGQVIGVVDMAINQTAALLQVRNRVIFALLAGILALIIGAVVLNRFNRRTLQPIHSLTLAAESISQGNLRYPLPVLHPERDGEDEIEQLTRSFHSMSQQLRHLVGDLETRVAERTQGLELRTAQLQAAAEIARDVTMQADVETLLFQSVNLVRQRFDFYHAGVFLLDESGEYAVLRAATGEAGRQMLSERHRLRVGRVGIVGAACGDGEAHVAADVENDPSHFKNPILPDTQAEAALPLRVGDRIIGALDVQSKQPNAFGEEDLTVLQIIADQLAIAVNNARLIEELNRMVAELQEAQGQVTQKNWQDVSRSRSRRVGYRYIPAATSRQSTTKAVELTAVARNEIPVEARRAIQSGETVQQDEQSISVPIRLRGHAIGAIHMRFDAAIERDKVAGVIEEVSDRLGLVMESARLLQEAQRLAQREQQINVIATEMRSSVNLETVLQNTVRELGKALGARRAYIQVGDYADEQPMEAGRDA